MNKTIGYTDRHISPLINKYRRYTGRQSPRSPIDREDMDRTLSQIELVKDQVLKIQNSPKFLRMAAARMQLESAVATKQAATLKNKPAPNLLEMAAKRYKPLLCPSLNEERKKRKESVSSANSESEQKITQCERKWAQVKQLLRHTSENRLRPDLN